MYLGIDVGGTKTLVACLDGHGVIKEKVKFPTPPEYGVFLRDLAKVVANLSTQNFVAACVALPGKVDRENGIGVAFGNLAWKKIHITRDMKKMVHYPVIVENDANLAGLSEAMLLKEKYNRVLYVTISTGIGTGFIANQAIDPELADSEGGYLMLEHHDKVVPWQSFASGKAIVHRFGKRAEDITDTKTWKIIAHDLAIGFTELCAIIQPEVIVVGGGVGRYFKRFDTLVYEELKKYATPLVPIPKLLPAARPDDAVVYGCYDLAKNIHGHSPK